MFTTGLPPASYILQAITYSLTAACGTNTCLQQILHLPAASADKLGCPAGTRCVIAIFSPRQACYISVLSTAIACSACRNSVLCLGRMLREQISAVTAVPPHGLVRTLPLREPVGLPQNALRLKNKLPCLCRLDACRTPQNLVDACIAGGWLLPNASAEHLPLPGLPP